MEVVKIPRCIHVAQVMYISGTHRSVPRAAMLWMQWPKWSYVHTKIHRKSTILLVWACFRLASTATQLALAVLVQSLCIHTFDAGDPVLFPFLLTVAPGLLAVKLSSFSSIHGFSLPTVNVFSCLHYFLSIATQQSCLSLLQIPPPAGTRGESFLRNQAGTGGESFLRNQAGTRGGSFLRNQAGTGGPS